MREWSNGRIAWTAISSGCGLGMVATLSVVTYWRNEPPHNPPEFKEVVLASVKQGSTIVIDVPIHEYEYLGQFSFATKTKDVTGSTVWATRWTAYNPSVKYKFVSPPSLPPGAFSVVLAVDYQLNPVVRESSEVKFLDLVVYKEE